MNRATLYRGWSGIRVAALTLTITCGSLLQATARATTFDAGTVLPMRLNSTLSSKDSQPGDTFTATLRSDSDAASYDLPPGTKIQGVVRMARPHHDMAPGALDLDFRRLVLPNGKTYSIDGSLIGLDNKSVRRTRGGVLVAAPSHEHDQLTYLGYGAGAGLVIGALAKRPVEGTIIGGGLGLLIGAIERANSRAHDITLKPGTELGVRLDRRLTLAAYDGDRDRDDSPRKDTDQGYHITEGGDRANGDRDAANADNNGANISVLIGDRKVNFDPNAQPLTSHGAVLVPAQPVMDALHIAFSYDPDTGTVRATGDKATVRLTLDSSTAVLGDGRRVKLIVPAQRLNDAIYVPIRFLELASGRIVSYDSGRHMVVIDNGDASDDD